MTIDSNLSPEGDVTAPPAPPLAGIHHVGLTVTDIERSEAWYCTLLGWQRLFVEPHFGSSDEGYAVVLGHPDYQFNIGLDHHPSNDGADFDPHRTGLDHLCFSVPDAAALDAWVARLDAIGVKNSGVYPVEGMPIRIVTFDDPDGIQLELILFHG